MKTITFYVVALLCLAATKLSAQSFEDRAEMIANSIEQITKQEKDSLKIEVEAVNDRLDNKEISNTEADNLKKQLAEKRAKNIEDRVAVEQQKLADLVKDKVDGKILEENKTFKFNWKKDTTKTKEVDYRRTTSQLVFAFGVNRLINDGEADENFKWRSDFYEWGLSWNTRMLKENNLLHIKYGLSLQYNNLRPDNNRIFVKEGSKTVLADSGIDLDVARLRYVNLVVPVFLELDFTKKRTTDDRTYFPSHKSVRVGLGGYAGVNVKEKQIIKYENENGNNVKNKTKGDYNVNDFVYGVSAYIGYRSTSLYAKYDLQPVFSNNEIDQNNLSLGIRFDFN
ncbi:hypothetical protein [Flavobacterium subsaxonicum]|uniref:Outer membrane protein beta-barrel domain-containing protein n=1 Tax=Flavobacterium subsaxonicum WB 4.1-42 = DSM 21790 TaxID=1121898 RepID=A0A0A2MHD5_9FLAO|nr:hypothetical protein [Flavobacterium subsaxonicum]KGO92077.1 hypothetical protein Q766_14385 [Flavobacterium subsaxonicum WB 4.1-42 = DSM 21790]